MRWGIIGTGRIARTFAAAVRAAGPPEELRAVACRAGGSVERPEDFTGAAIHAGYERIIDDPTVDVVYVATPHSLHREWSIAALAGGKHVLCEKPIGTSAADAVAVVAAARSADRFLAEAFMYRFGPLVESLVAILRSGEAGRIRLAEAGTGNRIARDPRSRLFDPARGGGAILDLGGYPLSIVRLVAGMAAGTGFADPVTLSGAATLGPTGVEEWAAATLAFPDGLLAQVRCGITVAEVNGLRLWGEEGTIAVTSPFFAGIPGRPAGEILFTPTDGPPRRLGFADAPSPFVSEVRAVSAAVAAGRREPSFPAMSWADTIGNMVALDRWRASVVPAPAEG